MKTQQNDSDIPAETVEAKPEGRGVRWSDFKDVQADLPAKERRFFFRNQRDDDGKNFTRTFDREYDPKVIKWGDVIAVLTPRSEEYYPGLDRQGTLYNVERSKNRVSLGIRTAEGFFIPLSKIKVTALQVGWEMRPDIDKKQSDLEESNAKLMEEYRANERARIVREASQSSAAITDAVSTAVAQHVGQDANLAGAAH